MTSIEWTDETWNPTTGCDRVSEGCRNCYIERTPPFRMNGRKLGDPVQLHPDRIDYPLHWAKPRRVFVNSLSDLFHKDVPDEFIAKVYAVMVATSWHTFQVLTKRPERRRYLLNAKSFREWTALLAAKQINAMRGENSLRATENLAAWNAGSARNIHEGLSIEDQTTADERIPLLLQTPAAVRFVSAEPLLGALNMKRWLGKGMIHHFKADVEGMLRNRSFAGLQHDDGRPMTRREAEDALFALHAKGIKYIPASSECVGFDEQEGCPGHERAGLDWVIAGGESGPGARRSDLVWYRSIVEQCKAAEVPVFVKQLGARPFDGYESGPIMYGDTTIDIAEKEMWMELKDTKGGDPAEWPEDLRVREFPR